MFEVHLYKNASDNRVLEKSLSDEQILNCINKSDDLDLLNPEITLASRIDTLSRFNYAYIPDLHRYYYINAQTSLSTMRTRLSLKVDVLMSYKEAIRSLTGTVKRSETVYNGYISDERYKTVNYKAIVTKRFQGSLDNDSIILMTVG